MGNKIQLFGELESVAVDKKLVDAVQVKDSAWVDPDEMIRALAAEREPTVTEETQSKINERLREEALYAQSQLQQLSIHYDRTAKRLHLLLEGKAIDGDGIDASDFTKDGMLETVLGPVTPVWNDVTDRGAAGQKTEKVEWAVNEDTGEQAFFALDVPPGYLLIQEITLGNTYLGFIWNTNTDANKTEGKVYDSENFKASALDVSTTFNPIYTGPGLEKVDDNPNLIKIKIKAGDKYLDVDNNGLRSKNIDDAIEDKVATINNKYDQIESALDSKLAIKDFNPVQTMAQKAARVTKHRFAVVTGSSYEIPATVVGENSVVGNGKPAGAAYTVIRNVHAFYEGEEIEVLVKYDYSRANPFRNKKVTVSWSGITPTQDKAMIVTYERVEESQPYDNDYNIPQENNS